MLLELFIILVLLCIIYIFIRTNKYKKEYFTLPINLPGNSTLNSKINKFNGVQIEYDYNEILSQQSKIMKNVFNNEYFILETSEIIVYYDSKLSLKKIELTILVSNITTNTPPSSNKIATFNSPINNIKIIYFTDNIDILITYIYIFEQTGTGTGNLSTKPVLFSPKTRPNPQHLSQENKSGNCFTLEYPVYNSKQCTDYGGYWDVPAEKDEDCPYYKANKNYPNNFGGRNQNGYCELPSGLLPLGYKGFLNRKYSKPICYNCRDYLISAGNDKIGHCCHLQYDKSLYPDLNGPDYKFTGDTLIRKQFNLS